MLPAFLFTAITSNNSRKSSLRTAVQEDDLERYHSMTHLSLRESVRKGGRKSIFCRSLFTNVMEFRSESDHNPCIVMWYEECSRAGHRKVGWLGILINPFFKLISVFITYFTDSCSSSSRNTFRSTTHCSYIYEIKYYSRD